jgi:formate dehydrogenase maturation protein FdhE
MSAARTPRGTWAVVCARCGAGYKPAHRRKNDAEWQAQARGWRVSLFNERQLCPACHRMARAVAHMRDRLSAEDARITRCPLCGDRRWDRKCNTCGLAEARAA